MSHAQILLSTYDGERYLEPLLASVLGQDHPCFSILTRDDGSSDATAAILRRHAGAGKLRVLEGDHVGTTASFIELLRTVDADAEHFAFCDQDDIWLPDKLRRATRWLADERSDTPALYCGRTRIVDAQLRPLGLSPLPRHGPCFENALVENIATGCTVVLNRAARALLISTVPRVAVAHDWWAYLVVAAFGRVLYDSDPKVLYRQHAANAVGAATSQSSRWARRIRPFLRNRRQQPMLRQALELRDLFGHRLDATRARRLARFIDRRRSAVASAAYALRPDVFRQGQLDNFILRALLGLRLA